MALPVESRDSVFECRGITVDYDGTRALDGMSVDLKAGEIVGLVGPNGAGKTTLGRVIVGELPQGSFQGELRMGGSSLTLRNPIDAHRNGIVLIHQEGGSIPDLSVGENVMLTVEPRSRTGVINWARLHRQAKAHLAEAGVVDADTHARVADVSASIRHVVDIARGLALGGRVFVFDEATAALGAEEVRTLLQRMRDLRGRGAAIVFISHRLNEVLQVSDRIIVMRDGRIVLDKSRSEVNHESLVRAMLGSEYQEYQAVEAPAPEGREKNLELRDWTVPRPQVGFGVEVGPINVSVGKGEVLGVFGPLGAGKTELLYSIFGLSESSTGVMTLDGTNVHVQGPREAMDLGIGLIPSDRQREGIVQGLSVIDNLLLSTPPGISHRGVIRRSNASNLAEGFVHKLGIKVRGLREPIDHLSGGNQQKVLLARAMATNPKIMLLDEATRGIDVGAKVEVYELVKNLAQRGTSFLFTSMEAEEILRVANRILVMRDGRQLAILAQEEATERRLLNLATGGN